MDNLPMDMFTEKKDFFLLPLSSKLLIDSLPVVGNWDPLPPMFGFYLV